MEIRHLVTFQAILETGSYTGAAVNLGYTQSTLTAHIQALESEIGGPLFTYVERKLQLTPLGRELIPLAEDLLSTRDQIRNMKHSKKMSGTLTIAAPESLTISMLGPILQDYSLQYPEVNLVVTNGTCGENQSDVLSGRVDVAFMIYPDFQQEKCLHYSLGLEDIVLVTHPDGPDQFGEIKQRKPVYLTNEKGCSYRMMFEKHLMKQDLEFPTMELWSIEAIKQMVISGLGFAALPRRTVQQEIETGRLKKITHEESFSPLYSHMLIRNKKWLSPAVEAFLNTVQSKVPEIEEM
ncbi:LysR family transcriptional regulator [Halobacillus litoralis]|uniref:LysR family transcriptional regulator n=1 Tax=Halobacillus litoralis TaxID=45668 RepID=A0A845DSG7_9BACI|nr:LysR family transcriptional regulator [Halobacillus litoralis]MYL20571.1 LysR family transcriptional regulator [Halobacillus litoralis]